MESSTISALFLLLGFLAVGWLTAEEYVSIATMANIREVRRDQDHSLVHVRRFDGNCLTLLDLQYVCGKWGFDFVSFSSFRCEALTLYTRVDIHCAYIASSRQEYGIQYSYR